MNEIFWPEGYIPGFTDNFASNEVIAAGLGAADVWPLLSHPALWPSYYGNAANVRLHGGKGPELELGLCFYFETFGFPVECEVLEYVAPVGAKPGRLAWHAWSGAGGQQLDAYHAWLIENLPNIRVRILTQESQNGLPAKQMAATRPNPLINGHQDWLEGLVSAARARAATHPPE